MDERQETVRINRGKGISVELVGPSVKASTLVLYLCEVAKGVDLGSQRVNGVGIVKGPAELVKLGIPDAEIAAIEGSFQVVVDRVVPRAILPCAAQPRAICRIPMTDFQCRMQNPVLANLEALVQARREAGAVAFIRLP